MAASRSCWADSVNTSSPSAATGSGDSVQVRGPSGAQVVLPTVVRAPPPIMPGAPPLGGEAPYGLLGQPTIVQVTGPAPGVGSGSSALTLIGGFDAGSNGGSAAGSTMVRMISDGSVSMPSTR